MPGRVREAFDLLVSPRMLDEPWRMPDGRELAAGSSAEAAAAGALLTLEAAAPAEVVEAFAADFARLSKNAVARALLCRAAAAPGLDTDALARAASPGKNALSAEVALMELLAEDGSGILRAALDAAQRAVVAAAGAPAGFDAASALDEVARGDANAATAMAFLETAPASEVFGAFAARVVELSAHETVCEVVARVAKRDPSASRGVLWRASWANWFPDGTISVRIANMLDGDAAVPEDILAEIVTAFASPLNRAMLGWLTLMLPRSRSLQAVIAACMRAHRERTGVTLGPFSTGPRPIVSLEDNLRWIIRDTETRCRGLHASAVIQATHASDLVLWGHLLLCDDTRLTALYEHRFRHESSRIVMALLHAVHERDGERAEPLRRVLAAHPDPQIRCAATSMSRSPARRAAERAAQRRTIAPEWQFDVDQRIKPTSDEPSEVELVELAPSATVLDALTGGYQWLRTQALLAARRIPDFALAYALAVELDVQLASRGSVPALLGAGLVKTDADPAAFAALMRQQLQIVRDARIHGPAPGQRLSPALERCLANGPAAEVERIASELGAAPGLDLEPWLADEAALILELPAALRDKLWPELAALSRVVH
jgi:hypothetical protein